jgi:phosphoglycolate phosphatase
MSEFNIEGYFDEILGLPNIHAKSKIDIGSEYMTRKSIKDALLIGDTVHDFEVATSLGVDCIIIPNGHQSREKLSLHDAHILDDISHVITYIDSTAL